MRKARITGAEIQGRWQATDILELYASAAYAEGEDADTVKDYIQRLGITFPVALDQQFTASNAYKVNSLPTTFFIDRNGVIRAQIVGQMNTAVLRQQLRSIYP